MISRMLSASPPGVSRRKISTSASRSAAVSITFSTCRTVAGPIGPSIAASSATRRAEPSVTWPHPALAATSAIATASAKRPSIWPICTFASLP